MLGHLSGVWWCFFFCNLLLLCSSPVQISCTCGVFFSTKKSQAMFFFQEQCRDRMFFATTIWIWMDLRCVALLSVFYNKLSDRVRRRNA